MKPGVEWLIPLLIIVVLFGAKKLPELANSMGRSIKEFRKGAEAEEDDAAEAGGDTADTGATKSDSEA